MAISETTIQQQELEEEYKQNANILKNSWSAVENLSVWTKLGAVATFAEFAFAKQSFVAVPAIYTDVTASLGNIFQHTNEDKLNKADFFTLGSSLSSLVGGYSVLASNGIETTVTGIRLASFAKSMSWLGVGLAATGFIINNYPEIVIKVNQFKDNLDTTYNILPKDLETQHQTIENSQFHLDVSLSYGFRPPKTQALYRVDGVLGSTIKINVLAAGLKDLEDGEIWQKSEVKNDSPLLKRFNILEPENYQIFSLKENQDVAILKTEQQFIGIKDSEPFHFQFPILKKENKILALSEILENNAFESKQLFHVEVTSEPPYCGDIIKQRNGDSLLYVCIVAGKADPSTEQIDQYITQRFNNEW